MAVVSAAKKRRFFLRVRGGLAMRERDRRWEDAEAAEAAMREPPRSEPFDFGTEPGQPDYEFARAAWMRIVARPAEAFDRVPDNQRMLYILSARKDIETLESLGFVLRRADGVPT